ncbi:hypothetical protein COO60DRAFT_1540451, partial [Scenedesmus sp. NREL 46B-D3]
MRCLLLQWLVCAWEGGTFLRGQPWASTLNSSCMYPPRICSSHRPASTLVGNLPLLLKVQPHAIGMRVDWHVHSWSARMGRLRLALRAFAHRRQQLK